MKKSLIEYYTRLAHGLAVQFGSNCEVVVHDLQGKDIEHSIFAFVFCFVTGRRIGDVPSQIVLESLHNSEQNLKQEDTLAYLTKTKNGKLYTVLMKSGNQTANFSFNVDKKGRLTSYLVNNVVNYEFYGVK